MKKATLLVISLIVLLFLSCTGPEGPPGRDGQNGYDGEDGSLFEAPAFEIKIDLVLNTDTGVYESILKSFPSDITVLSDDIVLMYRLEAVVDGLDVWRQLPQPLFSNEGLLFYNFDFTQKNYQILLEPEFDANLVPADLVQTQVFRIVVVPANLGKASKLQVDYSNIQSVLNALGVEEDKVQRIN